MADVRGGRMVFKFMSITGTKSVSLMLRHSILLKLFNAYKHSKS